MGNTLTPEQFDYTAIISFGSGAQGFCLVSQNYISRIISDEMCRSRKQAVEVEDLNNKECFHDNDNIAKLSGRGVCRMSQSRKSF